MNGLNYLLQTNLYLLLFMGFYVLVLRNETFFRQNRFFLNTSIFLSFLIPFINSDWFRDLFVTQKVRETAIMPTQIMYETIIVGVNQGTSSMSITDTIFWIYTSGAAFLLLRFLIRLIFLKSKLKGGKGAAFSFFNILVVDKEMPKANAIIDHEKVHMRQWHSADIIFIELAAIINWFNPVMYLYKKEIRNIHEFIADEEAANLMESKSEYAMLLFSNTLGVDPLHLTNNFFNTSLLKRRILMLNKIKSRSTGLWKYGFSAPLFMVMLIVSAATVKSEDTIARPVAETILSPLSSETSDEIMAVLKLDKATTYNEDELIKSSSTSLKAEEEEEVFPYFNTLKKDPIPRSIHRNFISRDNEIVKNHEGTIDTKDFTPGKSTSESVGLNEVVIRRNDTIRNFKSLEVQPTPPGGIAGWGKYLNANLKYPTLAKNNKVTGRVILSFIIEKDGSLSQIKVLRGIGSGADEEAVRVLQNAPKWKPGIYKGEPVRVAYTMPIWFQLASNASATNPKTNAIQRAPLPTGVKDFATVEVLPEFSGGMAGWGKYLSSNLKYPKEARDKNITGRVILAFIVEKDGSLSDINVLRGIGGGADEEAVRVLNNSPKWKPGLSNGQPARVAYTMPIFFQLGAKTNEANPAEPIPPKP